ncbi:cyclopropane-fatty-acyl-phospholipid synthase family protein [Raphidiopsis curvata NIES-932]|uniref:class I SAM-dependent methyltransferase n=1 Tax=Cylindrospermopsis raciborskii TaxID=77022 RepID=UPI000B60FD2C|nr:class I SAM-dependent methyltransferase [Cylindrospermopsis raciborskii]BAZ91312.1 cyclopropane-fatty-acyl-phospholipid synthase family protein [Raphidiopsis curvata NIES-932]
MSTKEEQYQFMVNLLQEKGPIFMTCRASTMWRQDPKLLGFTLARHKFVAKMLSGYNTVLEVGCGDAFASRLLHPEVKHLHSIDFDPYFIEEASKHKEADWPVTLAVHDILSSPYLPNNDQFDAAFSLDVIEHIPQSQEHIYLTNICKSLKPTGVFICGCPSLESQIYASPASKEGHVNCKSGHELKNLLSSYFEHTFLFGMNDEVLHTGFAPMCHYLFVLAVGNKITT